MVILLGAVAILLAALLAGIVGFAYALIALPLLLAIGIPLPQAIVVNLCVTLLSRLVAACRLRHAITQRRVLLLLSGLAPGVACGLLVREVVDVGLIELAAGAFTLVALVLVVGRRSIPAPEDPTLVVAAGTMGGLLGVTTSLSGLMPALLLTRSNDRARTVLADLSAYAVAGSGLALLSLAIAGHLQLFSVIWMLLVWVPAGLVGNTVGIAVAHRLPHQGFRWLTIVVIGASAIVSTVRASIAL